MRLLSIDVETGGCGDEYSLLSLAVIARIGSVAESLDLKIKPDDGIYKVCAEGMAVNKINLVEHDKTAITYKEAGTKLYQFLNGKAADKFIPIGKNIARDIRAITTKLISPGSWDKFCSYRCIELSSVGMFLIQTGRLPGTISGSLSSYCEHFMIDTTKAHDAFGDAQMNLELWDKFLGK